MAEIAVGAQHRESVPKAERDEKGVDGADLDTTPTAPVSQLGGVDVVATLRLHQGTAAQAFEDEITVPRPPDALEHLLEDQPGGGDVITRDKDTLEVLHSWVDARRVAAQGQRPDARVDEEHRRQRARSALWS